MVPTQLIFGLEQFKLFTQYNLFMLAPEKIAWGIIGCGDVTEVKSGPAFNKVPNSELHAVMRRNKVLLADYAKRHAVPHQYTDVDALIADPAINAIYIATPPKFHEPFAIKAMAVGKPVYVEKPVTRDVAEAKRMQSFSDQTGVKMVVAHYRRALPMFIEIKRIIETGVLGKINLVTLQYFEPAIEPSNLTPKDLWRIDPSLAGAGLFYDIAPHQIDIMVNIFGKPLKYGGNFLTQLKTSPVEDTVNGWIHFDQDILFTGTWGFSMPEAMKRDHCEIIGDKGSLSFNFFGTEGFLKMSNGESQKFIQPKHIQQPMIEKVVQYFLGKTTNPSPIEEAIWSMEVMENFVYEK